MTGHVYDEQPWGPGAQPITERLDANSECAHGRLAGDPSPVCGCWRGLEDGPVVELVRGRVDAEQAA